MSTVPVSAPGRELGPRVSPGAGAHLGRRRNGTASRLVAAVGALMLAAGVASSPAAAVSPETTPGADPTVSPSAEPAGTEPGPAEPGRVQVTRAGSWPAQVVGPFTVTTLLQVESGAAGSYVVTNGDAQTVTHDIAAGQCTEPCTITTELLAAAVPFGAGSAPTTSISGTLTLEDGTTAALEAHTYTTPAPDAGRLSIETPWKGTQYPGTLVFDQPVTVRLNATTLPADSLLGPAEVVTVMAFRRVWQPDFSTQKEVVWQRTYPAEGPASARYADVVIDPADTSLLNAEVEWAVGRHPADVTAGGEEDLTYGALSTIRLDYMRSTARWSSHTNPEPQIALSATPSAEVSIYVPAAGWPYPKWITGYRIVMTETRVDPEGRTSTRTFDGYNPFHSTVTRSHLPMSTRTYPLGYSKPGAGKYTQVWRVYSDDGMPLGQPLTTSTEIRVPTLAVKAPPLVVGRSTPVTATATYPWAANLTSCGLALMEGNPGSGVQADLCTPANTKTPSATRTGTVTIIPQRVGVASWSLQVRETPTTGVIDYLSIPAGTVHAEHRPRVAVPDATIGTTTTAVLSVKELRTLGAAIVPVAGTKVTLQRKAATATTWSTVGTYTTGTNGLVNVPVTVAAAPQHWRITSVNGAGTWTSPVDGSRALAKLVWTSAPTTVVKGRATTFTTTVTPAEPGSSVQLHVKAPGSTTWVSVSAKAVPSTSTTPTKSSLVTFSYAFSKVGTWQIRAVRPQSTTYGSGWAPNRNVIVK